MASLWSDFREPIRRKHAGLSDFSMVPAPGFWERHIFVDDREQVMKEVARALEERINVTVEYGY